MAWLNRMWCGFLLAGFSCVLQAAEVQNMYEVQMPVTDQNQESRSAAFEQGFVEVLVRVSGNSKLTGINTAQAPGYVQQYRYLQLEKPATPEPAKADGPAMTHNLWMRFDENAIKKLLRSNGLSIWGSQRPEVLVWLAVRDGQNRYILRHQDVSPIRDAVMAEGARRGLPLIWPIYDTKESKLVQFADIWGGFFDSVATASQRYTHASAVLVGRMDWQKKSGWQIDWSLFMNGQQTNWQQRSMDLPVLMAAGINPVADQLASRFAVVENASGVASMHVLVNGVVDAETYTRVARYLQSLALVKQVYATDILPGQAQFYLDINGGEDDLRRTIALERILSPEPLPMPVTPVAPIAQTEPAPSPPIAAPLPLRYRLN
jgi:uncharacterized protein